jgi:hypothetical protein
MNAWNHSEAISFLINFALDSLKLETLAIEQEKKPPKNIRPQAHVLLQAPKGSFKSTALEEISVNFGVPVITNITLPGLVGSVDKDMKQVIPAAAWKCRNGPFLLDEWADDIHRKEVVNALLQLTESGKYARSISRLTLASFEELDGPLYFKAKDGRIEIKTHFSLIMATMHNLLRSTNDETQALISRCVPYSFLLSQAEMQAVIKGKPLLILKPREPK